MPAPPSDEPPRWSTPLPLRERLLAAVSDRLPLPVRTARWVPSWRAALALAVVGVLSALVAGVVVVRSRPHEVAAPRLSVPAAASLRPAPSPSALVVVDVVGSVRRPGVVRLAAGSRVVDALAAAGGVTSGASPGLLNLAAPLTDGQQIVVGGAGGAGGAAGGAAQPGSGSAGGGSSSGSGGLDPGALLDLNSATLEQLDGLPGVGPVLAQRILDWRTAHNRFDSVDQLAEVGGIGERKLADIRKKVRV